MVDILASSVPAKPIFLVDETGTPISGSNPLDVTGGGGGGGGAVTIADGANVTQGAIADAAWSGSGTGTVIAILKKLVAELSATLTVTGTVTASGTVTANAGTNLNTSTLALETGGNLATIATRTPALGQTTMAGSQPVAIASNQSVLSTQLVDVAGTNIAGVDSSNRVKTVVSSALPAGSNLIGNVEVVDSAGTNKLAVDASGRLTLVPNSTVDLNKVAGNSIAPGNNAVPVLNSAATGYVAAYGSNAAALTANTDYLFKWGAGGTTQVNHIMIQNNTSINILWDLDVATNAASPILINTAPGNTIFIDVQTSVLHLQGNGTPNVNGSTAGAVVVRGWL